MTSIQAPPIILFSASPRRSELLERAGLPFTARPVDADESITPGLEPSEVVVEIALRKLMCGLELPETDVPSTWGLAADTLVEGPEGLMGKPIDVSEATQMLGLLSGRDHRVHSGFAVSAPGKSESPVIRTAFHTTVVRFRRLGARDISAYIRTGEWEGAAGAYRIQQRGELLVEEIRGLWSTVVGLPLPPLYGILSELSYPGV